MHAVRHDVQIKAASETDRQPACKIHDLSFPPVAFSAGCSYCRLQVVLLNCVRDVM